MKCWTYAIEEKSQNTLIHIMSYAEEKKPQLFMPKKVNAKYYYFI